MATTLPKVTVKANATSVKEGASVTYTFKLSKATTSDVKIAYKTTDGTAKAGSDYTQASGSVTFKAGETSKTVTVKTLSDTATESTENFKMAFTNQSTKVATLSTKSLTEKITDVASSSSTGTTGTTTPTTSTGQTFTSTSGNDPFTATSGADKFVYAQQTTGQDTITGFDPKMDVLVFGQAGATNESKNANPGSVGSERDHNANYVLDSYTTDTTQGVVITTDHKSSITLLGVHKADLSPSNFEFH